MILSQALHLNKNELILVDHKKNRILMMHELYNEHTYIELYIIH